MIAIYSRKSKFTGTGDSVENQVQICKEYIKRFDTSKKESDFKIYEDEGFSGKNVDRPMFKIMMNDIKNGLIDTVICYRLDRISRKVSDFSNWLDTIQQYNVNFISVKESFDTTTPMGRAMIHIASVFSQLERETIAERVRDNKIEIAKSGRWQGGNAPIGLIAEKNTYTDENGKTRTCFYLKTDTDSKAYQYVKTIFSLFKEKQSLAGVETYCLQNNIKSPFGKYPSLSTIRQCITNPIYVSADESAYSFLKDNGCLISSDKSLFDGSFAMVSYGKTGYNCENKRTRNDFKEWIIAVGRHKPFITGDEWIAIMKKLYQNKAYAKRFHTSNISLLSGLVKCHCGSPMVVKNNRVNSKGENIYYYQCLKKSKSHGVLCNSKNINGILFDKQIVVKVNEILKETSDLNNQINSGVNLLKIQKQDLTKQILIVENDIEKNQQKIKSLLLKLIEPDLTPAINEQINILVTELSDENSKLKSHLSELKTKLELSKNDFINMGLMKQQIKEFRESFEIADHPTKIKLLKGLIEKINYKEDGTFNISLLLERLSCDLDLKKYNLDNNRSINNRHI